MNQKIVNKRALRNTLIKLLFLIYGFHIISCTVSTKVKDGRTAFELKQYAVAAKLLEQEFSKAASGSERYELAYTLGQTYRSLRQFQESYQWFDEAAKYNNHHDIQFWKAKSAMNLERYQEAEKLFILAGQLQGNPRLYALEISAARSAQIWLNNSSSNPYKIKRLQINSPYFEFSPYPYDNGYLVFTSDRPQSFGNQSYKMTGNKFSSLFTGNIFGNDINLFDLSFISSYNDASLSFNHDKTRAVFVRCGSDQKTDDYCKLYMSTFESGYWSVPELLNFTEPYVNYRTPSFSTDGNWLLFASDVNNSTGVFDLYVSEYYQGQWQNPIPLTAINSSYNEISPFMHYDTLYFASDRTGGMGGYDIYSTFLQDGKWTSVQNLMAPINSGGDDLHFVIDTFTNKDPNKVQGYFVSNRAGGVGADDIYYFERYYKTISDPLDTSKQITNIDSALFTVSLELVTQEKEFNIPDDPNSGIRFRRPLPNANLQIFNDGKQDSIAMTNSLGIFKMKIKPGHLYRFVGSKDNYLSSEVYLDLSDQNFQNDTSITVRLLLEKIFINKELVLENIYYDFDRWEIRPDAMPTLDSLAALLKITPGIKIKLGSHTDCRGSDTYNLELSQKRAESAVQYLIKSGISPDRLLARGYGESAPLIPCECDQCTEEQHQKNRRTTFAIIE